MGLSTYNEKRNFKSTAEPKGKVKNSGHSLIFVVQKHNASRLHYDFRLELDGVLLSWAVPKGPSLNPAERHLAVQVEDHPYDYKDFEGTIPEGNYGAGEVIVWDNGTYHWNETQTRKESEAAMRKGIAKGHLEIVLDGQKLKGLFHLVRLKNTEWLLIKSKDEYAAGKDILKNDKSVLTGKTLSDYAPEVEKTTSKKSGKVAKKTATSTVKKKDTARKKTTAKKQVRTSKKKARPVKVETRIEPMLARLAEEIPKSDNLLFELKYDGYRAIASTGGDGEWVDLYSRNKLSLMEKFPGLKEDLAAIPYAVVLDGEIVAEDKKGISRFQMLQQFGKTQTGNIRYYVFDLLFLNGEDLRALPLTERRKLLETLFKSIHSEKIQLVESRNEVSPAFMKALKKKGYEGIIVKRADSPYLSGTRNDAWLKIKNLSTQEAVIIGYTQPGGSRSWFGSLLLAAKDGNQLRYIGKCGTGFSTASLGKIYRQMQKFVTKKPAVSIPNNELAEAVFLKPQLICEVRFTEFTSEGILRHPSFRGLREDKSLEDLNNEYPIPMKGESGVPSEKKSSTKAVPLKKASTRTSAKKKPDAEIELSNPDKIFWPALKITKGMLFDYYREASSLILPFIINRLHSLNRHPNGITGKNFYQKNMNVSSLPAGLETHKIRSGSGRDVNYFLCNSEAALLYMVNMGCIEINPWNNTVDSYDHPDWMVIDLDPEEISFREVVKTALEVRKLFDELGVKSFIKTSGSTGLHIYVPMGKLYTYDEVRMFAELIARTVHARLPDITSIVRAPSQRKKKVYIDYLQNRHGQTLAAPFSARPKPAASVSMPLDWSEVNARLSPDQFTIRNMMKRSEKAFELWKPVLGKGVAMKKILMKLSQGE